MAKRTPPTHPKAQRQLKALGERLRAARQRRSMTQEMLSERVGVSVPTIGKLEAGDPTTSLATMLRVLMVLGLASDIDLIGAQDALGRELQDNALKRPRRTPTPAPTPLPPRSTPPGPTPTPIPTPTSPAPSPPPRRRKP